MLHRAQFEAQVKAHTVLLSGDFNSPQSGDDSGAYRIITGENDPLPVTSDFQSQFPIPNDSPAFKLLDLKAETPREFVSGHFATYTGLLNVGLNIKPQAHHRTRRFFVPKQCIKFHQD